jgi:hypothetical protein
MRLAHLIIPITRRTQNKGIPFFLPTLRHHGGREKNLYSLAKGKKKVRNLNQLKCIKDKEDKILV